MRVLGRWLLASDAPRCSGRLGDRSRVPACSLHCSTTLVAPPQLSVTWPAEAILSQAIRAEKNPHLKTPPNTLPYWHKQSIFNCNILKPRQLTYDFFHSGTFLGEVSLEKI